MKAMVENSKCVGCGLCIAMCPMVFQMKNGFAEAYVNPVPTEKEDCANEASDSCPVEAINID